MKAKALKDGDWALGGVEVIYYKKDDILTLSPKDFLDMKVAERIEEYKEPKKEVEKKKAAPKKEKKD